MMISGPDIEHKKNRLFFKEFQETLEIFHDAARWAKEVLTEPYTETTYKLIVLFMNKRFKEEQYKEELDTWLYSIFVEVEQQEAAQLNFKNKVIELISKDDHLFRERYGKKTESPTA